MSVIVHLSQTLGKLARGRPHERGRTAGLVNAMAALGFLAGRKLGMYGDARLRLGYGGRRHDWRLTRREDLTVLEEVFLDEDYDLAIASPGVVFDLGANFGAASVYFALRWPDARIIAVEPSPEMFLRLRETTAGYNNISCLSCAAGAADGTMPFTLSASSVGSGFFREEEGAEIVEVVVRSLDTLMTECGVERINLLKFDIEGAESLLFRDPAILKRIDAFVGEIHPDLMSETVDTFLGKFAAFTTEHQKLNGGRLLLRGIRTQ